MEPGQIGQWILDNIHLFLIAVGVVSIIPFIVGFVKGFRKISWGCVIWGLCAVGVYFALQFVQQMNLTTGSEPLALDFPVAIAITIMVILAVMVVVGIFALIFRPHAKKPLNEYQQAKADERERRKCLDLDEDEILKRRVRKTKPCFLNRLVGGVVSVVNFLVVLVAILSLAIVIAYATPFKAEIQYVIHRNEIIYLIATFVEVYTWDLLIIGFLLAMAYVGYRKGFAVGFYAILGRFGYLAMVVLAFYLPFSPLVIEGPLKFLSGFANLLSAWTIGTMLEYIGPTIGLLIVGALLCVILCIVWKLLMMAYKAIANLFLRNKFLCFVDGVFGTIVNILFGVLLLVLVVGLFYILDYCQLISLESVVVPQSPLMGELIKMLDVYLEPTLITFSEWAFF